MSDLKNYATCDLVKELSTREGVNRYNIPEMDQDELFVEGPAIVLVVED